MLTLEPTIDLIAGEPDPALSENALRVLEKRYLKKDESGKVIETPRELFWRVSWNLAQADAYYGATEAQVAERAKTFYRMLGALEFLPNSPTLMNAGLELQQLSACFVLPVEDSLSGIFQTLKESALIHQSGGGCVAGDSHVLTTFCGVERIATLYERVRALGVTEDVRPGHRVMDVSNLDIRTFAADPKTGAFATKQITHLWQWEVPGDRALRLRFFDGRPENIRFAQEILATHGISVTPQQDRRGLWSLTTTDAGFVPRFARLAQSGPGPKESLTLPEWVAKSPLNVVAAFLGGLIDSDGYVSLDRRRLEFSTVCPELAGRLVSLLSALGFNPSIRERTPGPRAKLIEYRIHMADAKRTPELVSMVRAWVHDPFRAQRLDLLTERVAHNTHARIPLPFELLEKLLRAAGVATRTTAIHRSAVTVGAVRLWLHHAKWGDGIGEDKLRRLVEALRPLISDEYLPLLEQLEHLAGG